MTDVDALQSTLADEHAAVYVLGVLGGRAAGLAGDAAERVRTAVTAAYDEHRARRDRLEQQVRAAGATPVAAEPAYRLTRDLTTVRQVAAAALRVQRRCATSYAALVAAGEAGHRAWAIDALVATARSEPGFGGTPQALPGAGTSGTTR